MKLECGGQAMKTVFSAVTLASLVLLGGQIRGPNPRATPFVSLSRMIAQHDFTTTWSSAVLPNLAMSFASKTKHITWYQFSLADRRSASSRWQPMFTFSASSSGTTRAYPQVLPAKGAKPFIGDIRVVALWTRADRTFRGYAVFRIG